MLIDLRDCCLGVKHVQPKWGVTSLPGQFLTSPSNFFAGVILFLGFMVVTYALALPVSLILESPIVSMEKIIRSKFTKKQTGSAS